MYDFNKVIKYLKRKLSQDRYEHSLMVAQEAKRLATKYMVDEDTAFTAGLLHDIAKELGYEESKAYIEKYNLPKELLDPNYKKIIHSDIGAILAKELFDISDDIYLAIKYHTIGNINMSNLAKIIFIADKIGRNNLSPEYEKIKKEAYKDLDKSIILYIRHNNAKLKNKGLVPHYNTIELLNHLEDKYKL